MPWFTAHAIMFVQFKDGVQDHYPVWENILLIEAPDGDTAHELAIARAKEDEVDDSSLVWDDRPATWVCAGVRKLISVSHQSITGDIGTGDELTFSEFDLPDRGALERLVAGHEVNLKYVE
jgi:Domain of unknown function (DUF4288)